MSKDKVTISERTKALVALEAACDEIEEAQLNLAAKMHAMFYEQVMLARKHKATRKMMRSIMELKP